MNRQDRRTYTTWHARHGLGLVWIDGDEGTGKRIVQAGGRTFGTHKWDRATPEEAATALGDEHHVLESAVCTPQNRCDYHEAT